MSDQGLPLEAPAKPQGGCPCPFPFSQLYMIPREYLHLSFCSYHPGVIVENQADYYNDGNAALQKFFSTNEELARRRQKFLAGDHHGAGCSPDCYWLNQWKSTGIGYDPADYRDIVGEYKLSRAWLTVGPDCNITCRYCLEPKEFVIDYNTCDATAMNVARDLVAQGGSVLLTGGEPFLPKFRLVPALEDLSRRENVTGWFEIHTNGMYLKPEVRDLVLRAPVKTVNVSMDTMRKELFEYLRRGGKFDLIWGNVRALREERDQRQLTRPSIVILCAVMKSTADHIIETAEIAVKEGLSISFNALFKGYFSPDFCREEGLHNLTLEQLEKLRDDILLLESRYGADGPIQAHALKGQVANLLQAKRTGARGAQVALGSGGEAPRKPPLSVLLRQRRFRAASDKVAQTFGRFVLRFHRRLPFHRTLVRAYWYLRS